VQPGLAGLMDGSVSTLAPIFATAFATQDTWQTFLVGLAGLDRRRHLDGLHRGGVGRRRISGRGSPVKRGIASG
jgi:erythrin-vacuolar iron transport family protein